MPSVFKLVVLSLLANAAAIQKTLIDLDSPPRSNYSATTWRALVQQLQGDYSKALYHQPGQIDEASLNIIWLPLLHASALALLTKIGVCLRGPSFASQTLPIHAPHSPTSPGASVWRRTDGGGIQSYGWVEVTHSAISKDYASGALPWFYVARGSGVSLNVGRTVVLDQSQSKTHCKRGAPTDAQGIPSCLTQGLDLSTLDSIQLLHAYDPGWDDSIGISWKQGFRHEILLLRPDLVTENEDLHAAVDRVAANPRLTADTKGGAEPAVMCGKWPRLFACSHEYPPLQYMSGSYGGVCSNNDWRAMMWHCGPKLERVRGTNDCKACPDSTPHDCVAW